MSKRARKSRTVPPRFASEDDERTFWATHDAADFFDWSAAERPTFPNLKLTTTAISLRLPISMLDDLRSLANKRDVPYQSLMKMFLADQIRRERSRKAS